MLQKLFSKRWLTRIMIALLCLLLLPSVSPSMAKAEGEQDDWNLVGQVGGTTKALALDGSTLYVGSGLHVLVMDVSDPATIALLGTSPLLPDFVESITVGENGKLYVACGLSGLLVLDASDPSKMNIAGTFDTRGYTESVALNGKYALVADGPQGLQVLDVSNPAKIATVSEAYPLAYAYDVVLSGTTAYLAGGGSGLFTVDLTDPLHPKEAGLTSLDGFTYDLQPHGGRLYAACAWGGISVLDLQTSLAPKQIAVSPTSGWAMSLGELGNDLLVFDGADGVMLYGTAPTAPVKLSSFTLGGFVYGGASRGTTVFALDREKGLMSLDFTKKSAPTIVSRWMPLLDGRRLTAKDGICYVAGGLSGMHVYDMENVAAPLETSWYDTGGGYANQVILADQLAYLSTHLATNEPLAIFDTADLSNPKRVGFVPNDEAVFNTAFRAIALCDGYIYVPGEFYNLCVDVRDPKNPKVASKVLMTNPVNGDCYGNLYVSTQSNELQLIDISNPQAIQPISSLQKRTTGEAIRFINPTTVITSAEPGIWIVDVSDPMNPKKIAELAVPGSAMDICLDGTTAYLASLGDGVQVVDLSDLSQPKLVDSFRTIGLAYDCFAKDGRVYVADSFAGMTVYQKGSATPLQGSATAQNTSAKLPLKTDDAPYSLNLIGSNQPTPTEAVQTVITSVADSGTGTLRAALENLQLNTTITFDPDVFPTDQPATILLESPLPEIVWDHLTIDASNAGVILDGSKLESGNGLRIYSFYNRIMGLQVVHFPQQGIDLQGGNSIVGGNRNEGSGPMGQGNLLSGNGLCGILVGGFNQKVLGNYVGVDVTGEQPMSNYDGVFVGEAQNVTVGSVNPGEGNVISGNQFINFDSWGDHTRVIGNIIGLNAAGTKAILPNESRNVVLESNVMDTVVGGTTPEERNIISGGSLGVVFSDPNSYSCALIGNYIGTDITGTKAIGNQDGVIMWTSGNHRVGGTRPGEANLISGNQNGVQLNGYGVTDNLVLGNIIGYDADGKPMPNECAISINMGQKHAVIGGYTSAEGNRIYGGSISMRVSESGAQGHFFAGNVFENAKGLNLFLENGANHNFVQGNTFGKTSSNSIRVDYGEGNLLRGNVFTGGKPQDAILLLEGGNSAISAPEAKGTPDGVVGKTVPFGRVEVYRLDAAAITPLGFAVADKDGVFSYSNVALTSGTKAVLLVSDAMGNTSAFSGILTIPNG